MGKALLWQHWALWRGDEHALPELARLTPYARWWEVPVRLAIVCGLCWVWLWTEGSALQILLALLLWFCGIWALALILGPRRAKTSPL